MTKKSILVLVSLVSVLALSGCYGEIEGGPAYYPSASFVATAQPVYYGGHATYYYNNHWVYRDGAHWTAYRSEPRDLYVRRQAAPPARRVYERPRR